MTKLFQGKKVAVLGLGLSGLATVRFLLKQGVKPTLMDTRVKVSGLDAVPAEKVDGIYLGELDANRLAKMDVIVVSPGLDLSHPAIRFAQAQGTQLIGDVEWNLKDYIWELKQEVEELKSQVESLHYKLGTYD